jgi:hypothetical protein
MTIFIMNWLISEALKHIEYYKNIDDVWKIYVEKPNVDAIVF